MPAPDLQTLLDVETEVERAFEAYLTNTLQLPALGSDSDPDVQTPRLEAIATQLSEGPQIYVPPTGTYAGRFFYAQKKVRLVLDLVYSPAWGQDKGNMRGLLRVALSDWDGILASFATKNYLFPAKTTFIQTDGERTINAEEKTETLNTTLEMQVFLNPAAFP